MEHYKKNYNNLSMEVLVDGETLFTKVDEYISIIPWKINLLACSQTKPYLFLAINNNIYVYKIYNEKEYSKDPFIILKTGNNSEISINSIKMGYLYNEEILVSVSDNGLIAIFFISNLEQEPIKLINDNDISTWGIAIYGPKGYIAVSANNFLIKMYKILKANNSKSRNEHSNENSSEVTNNKINENIEEFVKEKNSEISNLDFSGIKMSDSEISFEENYKNNNDKGKPIENYPNYILGDECIYFKGHKHNIPYISFSKDGKYLISSSIDSTIRIWNVSTGKKVYTKLIHKDEWNWTGNFIEINHGYIYNNDVVNSYVKSIHAHDEFIDRFMAIRRFFPNIPGNIENIREMINRGEIFLNSVSLNLTRNSELDQEIEDENENSVDEDIDLINSGSDISFTEEDNCLSNDSEDEKNKIKFFFENPSSINNENSIKHDRINKKRSYNTMKNDKIININKENITNFDIIQSYDLMGNNKLKIEEGSSSKSNLIIKNENENEIKESDDIDQNDNSSPNTKEKKKKGEETLDQNIEVRNNEIVDNSDYHEINNESTHSNIQRDYINISGENDFNGLSNEVDLFHDNDNENDQNNNNIEENELEVNHINIINNEEESFGDDEESEEEQDNVGDFMNAGNNTANNTDDNLDDDNNNNNIYVNFDFNDHEVTEYHSDSMSVGPIPIYYDINNERRSLSEGENELFIYDTNENELHNNRDEMIINEDQQIDEEEHLLDEIEDSDEIDDFPIEEEDYNSFGENDDSFLSFETDDSDNLHIEHSDIEDKDLTIKVNNNTFLIVSSVTDIYLLDKSGKVIDVLQNPFEKYCVSLNRYSRISILEWIPEIEVIVVANQKGVFGLLRIIKIKEEQKYKMVMEKYLPEKSPLYPIAGLCVKPFYSTYDPLLSYYLIYVTFLNGSIYIYKLKHNTNSFPLSLTQL
ncbi:WD40 repeat-like protein [Piromyces finnis]|uniref:WD40 repeat-like protein n=1 Tax=Piromyces finnis TaxID=1754191 RepID=A0A1Y1VMG8_9FUNG|nr:WD40 repeat-like protein [Piromyces finnis]|eukprot:ORX60113.1 WD40 repeat-like protein [Piromyces finnis]